MKDQISALVDGEIAVEDSTHLLAAIQSGNELGRSWASYNLIGDVMRNTPVFKQDFTERLMQKLENEPAVLAPKAAAASTAKTSAAWSVAASVAAVMFVGWMVLQQQVQQTGAGDSIEIAKADTIKSIPAEYLLAHQSYAPTNSVYIQPAAYAENSK